MNINIDNEKCTGCSYCMITCPEEAITLDIKKNVYPIIDPEKCTKCGECIYTCPNNVFTSDIIEKRISKINKEFYDVIIIGAGIGGLLTAA